MNLEYSVFFLSLLFCSHTIPGLNGCQSEVGPPGFVPSPPQGGSGNVQGMDERQHFHAPILCHNPAEIASFSPAAASFVQSNEDLIQCARSMANSIENIQSRVFSPQKSSQMLSALDPSIATSVHSILDTVNLLVDKKNSLTSELSNVMASLDSGQKASVAELDKNYQDQFAQIVDKQLDALQGLVLPSSATQAAHFDKPLQGPIVKAMALAAALETIENLEKKQIAAGVPPSLVQKQLKEQLLQPLTLGASIPADKRKGGHEFHISAQPNPSNPDERLVLVNGNPATAVPMSLKRLGELKKGYKGMLYATRVHEDGSIDWNHLKGYLVDPKVGFLISEQGVKSFDTKEMFILYNGNPAELYIIVEGIKYRIIFEHQLAAAKIVHDKLRYSVFMLVLDKPCGIITNGEPMKLHIRRVRESAPITFGGGVKINVNGKETNLLTNLKFDLKNRTLVADYLDDVRKNQTMYLTDHMTELFDKLLTANLLPITRVQA